MRTETKTENAVTASEMISDRITERLTDKQLKTTIERNTEALTSQKQTIDKQYLKNRVIDSIKEYSTEYGIDIYSIKQLQWNSVLEYIADTVIKPMRIDYRNTDNLMGICNIYISICHLYNKSTSLYGYSIITGISYRTILTYKDKPCNTYIDMDNDYYCIDSTSINGYRLKHKDNRIIEIPNNVYEAVAKKVTLDREHCLTDKTEDGSIPSLALGKIEFGWIESQKEKMQVEMIQKYTLPQDILKEYSENS